MSKINFPAVYQVFIHDDDDVEQEVDEIKINGDTVWKHSKFTYVSLGDSLSAGHRIDRNWGTADDLNSSVYHYGWNSQYRQSQNLEAKYTAAEADALLAKVKAKYPNWEMYGEFSSRKTGRDADGNTTYYYTYYCNKSTPIIPNSYTGKIREYLEKEYSGDITALSFGVSGSMVMRNPGENRSLMEILDDDAVKYAISNANLVTLSIGANTVLEPALGIAPDFLMNGVDLASTEAYMEDCLRDLADTSNTREVDFSDITSFSKVKYRDILTGHIKGGGTHNIYVDEIKDIRDPATNQITDRKIFGRLINNNSISNTQIDISQNEMINESSDYTKIERQIYSYKRLFDKLRSINPNANYVFNTVHNPMSYLYLERGTWDENFNDSFLGTWLNTIPPMAIGDWRLDNELKKLIIDHEMVSDVIKRVNGDNQGWEGIPKWVERYVDDGGISANGEAYLGLSQNIRKAVEAYNASNSISNFMVNDVKELFDTVPDRQGPGELHYNDLVNMQITRGYDANDMQWDMLWGDAEGSTKEEKQWNYWMSFLGKYIPNLENILENIHNFDIYKIAEIVNDITQLLTLNLDELVADLMGDLIENFTGADGVFSAAFDPHFRADGHYFVYRSAIDALNWTSKLNPPQVTSLPRIGFNANGGTGSMNTLKVLDYSIVDGTKKKVCSMLKSNSFTAPSGYRFTGWDTKSNGTISYSNAPTISFSELPATNNVATLYAQWSNQCIIKYRCSKHTDWSTDLGDTIPKAYALWINNTQFSQLGFDKEDIFTVPYGTPLGIIVGAKTTSAYNTATCSIYMDNNLVASGDNKANYDLPGAVTSDLIIDFQWHTTGVQINYEGKTSYEKCYIQRFDASYDSLRHYYDVSFTDSLGNATMGTQHLIQYKNSNIKTMLKGKGSTSEYYYKDHWHFENWKDQNGNTYSNKQVVFVTSNLKLDAQWSINKHKITVIQKDHGDFATLSSSNYPYRKLYLNGKEYSLPQNGSALGSTTTISNVAYGTSVKTWVSQMVFNDKYRTSTCNIYVYNPATDKYNISVDSGGTASGTFSMPDNDVRIEFWYETTGSTWIYTARVWWDVYIAGISASDVKGGT